MIFTLQVLFSLEEVSYYFPYKTLWRSFIAAMIGALSLQFVNPFRSGKLLLFQVAYHRNCNTFELPFFVLIGVIGGLYGAFFVRMVINLILKQEFKVFQVQKTIMDSTIPTY
jgi:chloride channel 3/4/5